MAAVVLAVMASLSWGLVDFLGGIRSRDVPVRAVASGTFGGGFFAAILAVAVLGGSYPGNDFLLAGLIAGLAIMVALPCLFKALAIGSMSIVAPISAVYPLVPVVYGLAHGEQPSAFQMAGMVAIVAGVAAASYVRRRHSFSLEAGNRQAAGERNQPAGWDTVAAPSVNNGVVGRAQPHASHHQSRNAASISLALVSAAASGIALTALSSAAVSNPYWSLVVMRGVAFIGVLLFVAATRHGFGVRPSQVPLLVGIGVIDVIATGLFAIATTLGYLSVVSVIASLCPLATIALAWGVLGERVQSHQYVGGGAALTGALLVALG